MDCLALAQVLLSTDEVLQLSAVQCVEEVLSHHMDYGMVLLRADIAGKFIWVNKVIFTYKFV